MGRQVSNAVEGRNFHRDHRWLSRRSRGMACWNGSGGECLGLDMRSYALKIRSEAVLESPSALHACDLLEAPVL